MITARSHRPPAPFEQIPGLDLEQFAGQTAVPASLYNFDELADLYNQTRVDYIVPMPMSARRLQEYVYAYDIVLDLSVVALSAENEITGLGMLGLRDDRAWISRLGVLPEKRGRRTGLFIMEHLLHQARLNGARSALLEVVKGNVPAHTLFRKLGFRETRELLIIRRPPRTKPLTPSPEVCQVVQMDEAGIAACLDTRAPGASWLEETRSLYRAGNLKGLRITLTSGDSGWIVYQQTPFQLTHIVCGTSSPAQELVATALLDQLHQLNPHQDAKVENMPADSPYLPAFINVGYLETFRRIEMNMQL
ncbi:MAG: GNAT family N-acetyltransferase [Aggregatilineales bacterium]